MGLLTQGVNLSWPEIAALADHVRQHGVTQFIHQYRANRDLTKEQFLWGDEIEYMLVHVDHNRKWARVSLKGGELVAHITEGQGHKDRVTEGLWTMEYADYMIESTPEYPYTGDIAGLCLVEGNMRRRREFLQTQLEPGEFPVTLSAFPRTGCPSFSSPPHLPTPSPTESLFIPQAAACPAHPRWWNLCHNPVLRRGGKMHINVPVFKDKKTPDPFIEDLSKYGDVGHGQVGCLADHIYMDGVGFGFGQCCLQATMQATNIDEARRLYDQFLPLCAILTALTASSPVYRGFLSDVDHRWCALSQALDDRTDEERGLTPLRKNQQRLHRSRLTAAYNYISEAGEAYNDVHLDYDKDVFSRLQDEGIDRQLSRHIAHLFVRDAISVFADNIHQDDTREVDHFENINSTNWQTLRLKLPPPGSDIGWRVEVRPMDIQITDFENAAYCVFVVLLSRAILSFNLNFIIPITKVDENNEKAVKRGAVLNQRFHFRSDITSDPSEDNIRDNYSFMTVDEIINGKGDTFPGLLPFVHKYLDNVDCDVISRCKIHNYLDLISKRASGEVKTTAHCIRRFFTDHPLYQHDSIVTERMNYDLFAKLGHTQNGLLNGFKKANCY